MCKHGSRGYADDLDSAVAPEVQMGCSRYEGILAASSEHARGTNRKVPRKARNAENSN